MFEIRLSCGDVYLDTVSLKCINCQKETGLKSKTAFKEFNDKTITPFVMNAMLHHVGMSWILPGEIIMTTVTTNMTYPKYIAIIFTFVFVNRNTEKLAV